MINLVVVTKQLQGEVDAHVAPSVERANDCWHSKHLIPAGTVLSNEII